MFQDFESRIQESLSIVYVVLMEITWEVFNSLVCVVQDGYLQRVPLGEDGQKAKQEHQPEYRITSITFVIV